MNWKYLCSSVRGTSHESMDLPKQDNYRIIELLVNDKNYLISAVADGAGSAKYSDLSSDFICKLFLKKTKQWLKSNNSLEDLTREIIVDWFTRFRSVLERAVKIYRLNSTRDFATTLLFSVLSEDCNIFVQIGDGIIAINNDSALECVFLPQNGEFINTTHFATEAIATSIFMFKTTKEPVKYLIMHTDGIEHIAFNFAEQKPFLPFFTPFLKALNNSTNTGHIETLSKQLSIFLQSDRVNKRTDDDKTLLVILTCGELKGAYQNE